MRIWIFAALLMALAAPASAQQPPAIEIPSKQALAHLFSLSEPAWFDHITATVAKFGARARQTAHGAILETRTANGAQVSILPEYLTSKKRPDFIQIIVGYNAAGALRLDDTTLTAAILIVEDSLAPEFSAIGSLHAVADGKGAFFIIRQRREPTQ